MASDECPNSFATWVSETPADSKLHANVCLNLWACAPRTPAMSNSLFKALCQSVTTDFRFPFLDQKGYRGPGQAAIASSTFWGSGTRTSVLVFSVPARADLVAPGTTLPPDIFPACVGCTLNASLNSGPITVSNGQGITLTFDVVSAVYSDPSNPFGAGDLDFVYQVTNVSGNDLIGRLTAGVFSGFMTDVGFTATGSALPGGLFVDGTQAPQLVNRSTAVNNGATVGFIYDAPMSSTFAPGTTSTALIIETDAKNFKAGNVNVIDDVVGSTAAFEPASAVAAAEPSSVALMLLGGGLVFVMRKRIGQRLPHAS